MNKSLLSAVIETAIAAGTLISSIYHSPNFTTALKEDNSPLTAADLASHNFIMQSLQTLNPNWPILSEESQTTPWQQRKTWQRYWLVDPLDGTKEFVNRNGEFTVNIALIDHGSPILGVVYAPELQLLYYAAKGQGAFCQKKAATAININTGAYTTNSPTIKNQDQVQGLPVWKIVASRSHPSPELALFLEQFSPYQLVNMGSSLKFCLVAAGEAHLYPRLGPTSEWDTAAAQCIVEEAGGLVVDTEFNPLRYNQKESLLNSHFIAAAATTDLDRISTCLHSR